MNMAYEPYSVLMAIYKNDDPEYFRISLKSMLSQSVPPDEVVLVLDGSIPHVLQAVIDELDTGHPNIIRTVALPKNVGLGTALKIGVTQCKNELIARMDADDISLPDRCKLQLEAFQKKTNLDIVGYSMKEFSGTLDNIVGQRNVPETNEEIYKFAKLRDPFNHPTVMFRKSKVLSSGNYGDYRKNQDSDLWIKMLSNHAVCQNLSEDQFRFRFDEETCARRKNWSNTKTLIEIRYKAWRKNYNSFFEFAVIFIGQMLRFLLPVSCQKVLYRLIK
ncbi:glycosyltransferase [Selenomonas sputigena]|uniref:glycosyltransferase n=1 Tax=Selenomonas sputigena TaxID=69823 RepID=UPI0022307ADC|nr:glycosyltransferase [Selenomonas sputigena]UZD42491.1 glycosyltransferase [Selenomonas sputigena]